MILAVFLKLFSDACLCFAILGTFQMVFCFSYQPVYAALLCGGGAAIAAALQESGKGNLRWLGILLPLISLVLADGYANMLILIPVVGYTAAVIFRGQFHQDYYGFRDNFRKGMILVCGLYIALYFIWYVDSMAYEDYQYIFPENMLRYGIVYIICGILLQRHLRLGAENRAHGSAAQIGAILLGTGTVILGFSAASEWLKKGAYQVFRVVLSVILAIPVLIYQLFFSIINLDDVDKMQEQVADAYVEASMPLVEPDLQQYIYEAMQEPRQEPGYWWVVLVVLLVLGVMIWLFFSYHKKNQQALTEERISALEPEEQGRKDSRRSNRGKIRQYYREYLRLERKRGIVLKKNMTTEDILQKITSFTDKSAAAQLRDVYLEARYNENGEITRQQVEEAREAIRKIRTP